MILRLTDMNETNLTQIIKQFPDCINNSTKLHAIIFDLYPTMPKGQLNALYIICTSGIVAEIRKQTNIGVLEKKRWLQALENDYCMSGKVVEACLDIWIEAVKSISSPTIQSATVDTCHQQDIVDNTTKQQTASAIASQCNQTGTAAHNLAAQTEGNNVVRAKSTNQSYNIQPSTSSEKPKEYVFHNQLGYGKIESSDSKWIIVRFDNYPFKTERYSKKDLGKYLRLIPSEEYDRYIQSMQKQKNPKKTSNVLATQSHEEFNEVDCYTNDDILFEEDDDFEDIKLSNKTYKIPTNGTLGFNSNANLDEGEWVRKYEMDDDTDYGYYDDIDYDE